MLSKKLQGRCLKYYDARRELFQALFNRFQHEIQSMLPETRHSFQCREEYRLLEAYLLRLLEPFHRQTRAFDILILKYRQPGASQKNLCKLSFLLAWEKKIISCPDKTINYCFELVKEELSSDKSMVYLLRPSENWMFYHKHDFRAFIQANLKENAFSMSKHSVSEEDVSHAFSNA